MTTTLINTAIEFPATSPKFSISLSLEKEGNCTVAVYAKYKTAAIDFLQEKKEVCGTTETETIKAALKVFNRMVNKYTKELLNK